MFQDDSAVQDAVFLFVWGSGQRTERTTETLESADHLIADIKEYMSGIEGGWRMFPTVEDRRAYIQAQIDKLLRWKQDG